MTLEGAISWGFIAAGALILIGFVRAFLVMLRLHESDMANWGELSDAEEAEADAQTRQLTRLMWAMGTTAIGALIWAERDWIAQRVAG